MDGIDMDETLVRSLLRAQHADLAGLALREVAGGWDNRMWRLGEDLAVRLPRTRCRSRVEGCAGLGAR